MVAKILRKFKYLKHLEITNAAHIWLPDLLKILTAEREGLQNLQLISFVIAQQELDIEVMRQKFLAFWDLPNMEFTSPVKQMIFNIKELHNLLNTLAPKISNIFPKVCCCDMDIVWNLEESCTYCGDTVCNICSEPRNFCSACEKSICGLCFDGCIRCGMIICEKCDSHQKGHECSVCLKAVDCFGGDCKSLII
jgi:hypothetical protein